MSSNQDLYDSIGFVALAVFSAAALYFLWTKPYNDFLNQTMDCMNEMGDHSQAAYDQCAALARAPITGEVSK